MTNRAKCSQVCYFMHHVEIHQVRRLVLDNYTVFKQLLMVFGQLRVHIRLLLHLQFVKVRAPPWEMFTNYSEVH